MGRRIEIKPGDKFGKLTIIKELESRDKKGGGKERVVLCQCDCGSNPVERRLTDLNSGKTTSCGCKKGKTKSEITIGEKYGRLTIIKEIEPRMSSAGNKNRRMLCKCDCGKEVEVSLTNLRRGHTKSCGCYKIEKIIDVGKEKKKYNTYDLTGEYGVGYTFKGEEFYFDLEDYDKIKDYYWRTDVNGYFVSVVYVKNKAQNLHLHRVIMLNKEDWKDTSIDIDHINGINSRNDNRKVNLRITTRSQNNQNRTLRSDTKSGFIGVSYNKYILKWESYLSINYKKYRLGYYNDFTEAVKARIEGEQKYFGEYAYKNHKKVLDFINNSGKLEPYNRQMIEDIMNQEQK